jgi:hypothetical protein
VTVTTWEYPTDDVALDISAEQELARLDRLARAKTAPPTSTPWAAIRRREEALRALRGSGDLRRLAAEFADRITAVANPADAPTVAIAACEELGDIVLALVHARGLANADSAR